MPTAGKGTIANRGCRAYNGEQAGSAVPTSDRNGAAERDDMAIAVRTLRRESLWARLPNWIAFVTLLVGAVVFSIPFVWTVSTALKTNEQVFAVPPVWIPHPVEWNNFHRAWTELPFMQFVT